MFNIFPFINNNINNNIINNDKKLLLETYPDFNINNLAAEFDGVVYTFYQINNTTWVTKLNNNTIEYYLTNSSTLKSDIMFPNCWAIGYIMSGMVNPAFLAVNYSCPITNSIEQCTRQILWFN